MDAWTIWLILAIVFAIAEVTTLTFVLGMLAGGAAAAAIAAAVGAPVAGQLVVFALVDALGLALVLPAARRHRHTAPAIRTGTARLVGTRAMALSDINTETGARSRSVGRPGAHDRTTRAC